MEPDYLARYRELYENHWWWRSREAFILNEIEGLLGPRSNVKILDVGCGDGLFFDRLERFGHVEGVEPEPAAVSSDGRWSRRIWQQPFDDSFAPGKRYSLILLLDVLEHARDPAVLVRRAMDLVEPTGSVIVTVPALAALWTSHDDLNHHFRRYSRTDLVELATLSGAEQVRCAYFFHWLVAAKLGTRLKEKLVPSVQRSPNVPVWWLNRSLEWVSLLEQRTLTRLPIPFGSSLLMVLKRPCHS